MQVAAAVIHRVAVLAQNDRLGGVVLGQVDALLDPRIHGADDIGGLGPAASPLIVDGPRSVPVLEIAGHGQVGRPVPGLVAQRPLEDAGEVLVPLKHPDPPIHDRVKPDRRVGGVDCVVTQSRIEPVRLHVGLVHQIDTEPRAQLVPRQHIGIMSTSDRIEIILFEHQDVLDHALQGHHPPHVRIKLVAVGPLHEKPLSIVHQDAISHLGLTESQHYTLAIGLSLFLALYLACEDYVIQAGPLGAPQVDVFGVQLVGERS